MSATTDQRTLALQAANRKRLELATLRRQLLSERGALADVLLNPPELLARWAIVDVVRLAHGKRSAVSVQRLGRLAVRDCVNLLMPLGEASERTRRWTAEHAVWNWNVATGGKPMTIVVRDES